MLRRLAGLVGAALLSVRPAAGQGAALHEFLSRPDIQVPRLTIDTYNVSAVAPGYIFLSPFYPEMHPFKNVDEDFEHVVNFHAGPVIYDNRGDVVWAGLNLTGHDERPRRVFATMGFERCDLDGMPHLCHVHNYPSAGMHHDILNQHYELVKTIELRGESGGHPLKNDSHDFNIKQFHPERPSLEPKRTALITASVTRKLGEPVHHVKCDITMFYVLSSVFQEVDLETGSVLFQWDSFDHISLQDSHCPGNDGSFRIGDTPATSWDHFHLNSVDKDANGDFYLSGRHTSTIYKLSGKDGSVIWQLGEQGTFQLHSEVEGIAPNFGYQHHLRLHEDYPDFDLDAGQIALSIFDNANDRYTFMGKTAEFSAGKIYLVNERERTATLKEAYTLKLQPDHQLATNQGSCQLLPNGNRLVGGGNVQEIIEWQPGNFDPVFLAHWGDWQLPDGGVGHKINSYRSFRFEWHGYPRDAPTVFSFALDCNSETTSYMSWNGATEVASWAVYMGATADGPFHHVGSTNRTGFESRLVSPFGNFVVAVAYDETQYELGRSLPTRVSVPEESERSRCQAQRCPADFDYQTLGARSCPPASLSAAADELRPADEANPPWLRGHCDPCFPLLGDETPLW